MKKKQIANIVMAAIILMIAAVGILTVGHIQGWFDNDDGDAAVLTQIRGIITMEREGVAYTAGSETVLRQGDRIVCGSGATCVIQAGSGYLSLGENAEVVIEDPSAETFSASVSGGEVFVNTTDPITLSFDGKTVVLRDAAAALSVRAGAQSISVFEGTVENASAGQIIDWVGETVPVSELKISTLNAFTIAQIRSANENRVLCFSNEDLDVLIAQREAELQAQLHQTEPNETEPPETTQPIEETEPAGTEEPETTPPETTQQTEPPATEPVQTEPPATEPVQTDPPATEPEETEPTETEAPTEAKNTCTITIRCDTILNNMDSLDPAKAGYVPESGMILSAVTVDFTEGETVFDVLTRVCSTYGIQIEYSWTPMYDSYYIEGINNLYEFDCGFESGWMYKVNGWFPNYGCSSYALQDGDSIVWCYTCVGLGADVGG